MIITPFVEKRVKAKRHLYSSCRRSNDPTGSIADGALCVNVVWVKGEHFREGMKMVCRCLPQKRPCEPLQLWMENGSAWGVDAQGGGKTARFWRNYEGNRKAPPDGGAGGGNGIGFYCSDFLNSSSCSFSRRICSCLNVRISCTSASACSNSNGYK